MAIDTWYHYIYAIWSIVSVLCTVGNNFFLFYFAIQFSASFKDTQTHTIRTLVSIETTLNWSQMKSSNRRLLMRKWKARTTPPQMHHHSYTLFHPFCIPFLTPKMSRCVRFHSLSFAYCIGDFKNNNNNADIIVGKQTALHDFTILIE